MIFDLRDDSDMDLVRKAIDGKIVGITSGSYDLFHHMHLVYLERCRRLCEILAVGVDSNDLIKQRKGPDRPFVPEHQRVAIVNALSCVHAAFILGSIEDFGNAVERLGAKVIFKNNAFREEEVLGRDKAQVIIIPDLTQHSSTSEIIEEVKRRKKPENTGPRI